MKASDPSQNFIAWKIICLTWNYFFWSHRNTRISRRNKKSHPAARLRHKDRSGETSDSQSAFYAGCKMASIFAGFLGYFTAAHLRSRAQARSESVEKLRWGLRGGITRRFCIATRMEILDISFYDEASPSLSSKTDADVENVSARFDNIKDGGPRWCAIVLISDRTCGTSPDNGALLHARVRRIVLMQPSHYL